MYLPGRLVTNADLEAIDELDTSDEWIQQRSGIKARRYISEGESGVDMAVHACTQAVANPGLTLDDIDFITYATLSPDYFFPGNGCFFQDRLFPHRTVGALDGRNNPYLPVRGDQAGEAQGERPGAPHRFRLRLHLGLRPALLVRGGA